MAALEQGNKREIAIILRNYKQPNGVIYFPALFEIPSSERLPQLATKDYRQAAMLVCAGITLSFETMNLVRSMNENQIYDLTDVILESSNEDNLSLEDLMLFLQKLTMGEYGKLYEGMDIPKFMEMFEKYREQRFQAMQNIREEQSVQYKAIPVNDRIIDIFGDSKEKHREALKDYLVTKHKIESNGNY